MMDTLKMDIDALLGERWFPKETSFEEDITEYWVNGAFALRLKRCVQF